MSDSNPKPNWNPNNNDSQSIDYSSSKGKQRQQTDPQPLSSSNQPPKDGITSKISQRLGGLSLNGIAPSASDLDSILSSGGKGVSSQNGASFIATSSQSASRQFHQDHSSHLANSPISDFNSNPISKPSFRSNPVETSTTQGNDSLNSLYSDFNPNLQSSSAAIQSSSFDLSSHQSFSNQSSSSSSNLDQFSPYNQGPYQSAKDLDPGLYAHAQAYRDTNASFWSHGKDLELEQSWNRIQSQVEGGGLDLEDPAYHEAWAKSIPGPTFPSFNGDDQVESSSSMSREGNAMQNDFMDLLQKEEEEEGREEGTRFSLNRNPIPNLESSTSFSHPNITSEWRPPSPSSSPTITTEQLKLHLDLSELQDGKGDGGNALDQQRKLEGLKPNDDQEHLREGIYARDPQEALKSFWKGDEDRREKFEERRRELQRLEEGGGEREVERLREMLKTYLPRADWIDVSRHPKHSPFRSPVLLPFLSCLGG